MYKEQENLEEFMMNLNPGGEGNEGEEGSGSEEGESGSK